MAMSLFDARAAVVREIGALLSGRTPAREEVPLAEAVGRVLAVDVRADRDQPPFHRSTRDGFAVRAADLSALADATVASGQARDAGGASAAPAGVALQVIGEVAAGASFAGEVAPGSCVEIMTGAPLPAGADAVVMVEHTTRRGPGEVLVQRRVGPGENLVPRGSELAAQAVALRAGVRIDPGRVGLLASLGVARPSVHARPRVAVLGTGDELVSVDEQPGPSQIRDSNRHTLVAQILRAGGSPLPRPSVRDDPAALRAALHEAAAGADLLLVSGGVSMGKHDHVEGALAELGARMVFDAVDIRPGRPLVFGILAPTSTRPRPVPFFGLPGNPLSTHVTFELFGRLALALLEGEPRTATLRTTASRLAVAYAQRKLSLTVFVPVVHDAGGAEDPTSPASPPAALAPAGVRPVSSQGSGDLMSLAAADLLMVVPPGTTQLEAGALVPVLEK